MFSTDPAHRPSNPLPKGWTRRPFRTFIRRHPRRVAIGLGFLLLTNAFDALPPLLIGWGIDRMTNPHSLTAKVEPIAYLFLVISALATCRYFWRWNWGRFHHSVAADLREIIFGKLSNLHQRFFQKTTVGSLMSLINNDVNYFRMAAGPGSLILIDAAFILITIPPLMMWISVSWTWKTLILMPLVPFFVAKIIRLIHERFEVQRDAFAEMSGHTQEVIGGIRVIKGFAQENRQLDLFNRLNRKFQKACNETEKTDAYFQPVLEIAVTAGAVILLIFGGPDVMAGTVTVGSFVAFYQYIQRMVWPMTAIGIGFSHIQRGKASFGRICEVLETLSELKDDGRKQISSIESLEFKNVSFKHPASPELTLKNVSFRIERGEILGVLGATGSGKSTLLDLITRLYDPDEGEILLNGHPLPEYSLKSLRRLIACIPQEAFLFSDKVKNNLSLDREIDEEELRTITRLIDFEEEIDALPGAFEAELGERGVNLSGGQKQRLTIARGLLRKAELLLLDDILSAVDASTEQKILHRINEYLQDKQANKKPTAIIVSHRLASLNLASKILVLDNGHVEAFGSPKELLASSPIYQRIHKLQMKGGDNEHTLSI